MPDTTALPPVQLSRRAGFAKEQAISFLMQQGIENPGVISLAAGFVDFASLPVRETRDALAALLADTTKGQQALQYGTTQGSLRLRHRVHEQFARLEGVPAKELGVGLDRILMTTGSQQLLSLLCEVLFNPGDICLVSGPTYFVFLAALQGVGAQAIVIPSDDNGLKTDALDATLQQLEADGKLDRVKLIYLVSYYENPSGISLSTERRREVVEIARRWSKQQRILILEDAAYRELRYDGPQWPSTWSFDPGGEHVIYTQTFSKSFSPGIRVGFGILPSDLLAPVCDRKGNDDFGSPNLMQQLLIEVLDRGLYEPHVTEVQTAYRVKRDAMLSAADEFFSDIPGANWVHPHGGLYVWMTLPSEIPTGFNTPFWKAAVHDEGVMYVPGELSYPSDMPDRPRSQMRLSFGVQPPEGIREGMRKLANAVRKVRSS
jgi:2-aminoadipate transaminase